MRTRTWQRSKCSPAALLSGVVLGVALLVFAARLVAPGLLLAGVAPLFTAGNALARASSGFFSAFGNTAALAAKNRTLAQANATLELENEALRQKAADLGALIGTSTPATPGITATVLARPPMAPYDTLILGSGSEAGITASMEAYGPAGTPLGLVESATGGFARVRLFTAPGVVTDAWVGSTRVPVTLHGAGAGAFSATVSQGSGIAVGDLVYLPGPPAGGGATPVARVAHIEGTASDPAATLAIASLVNASSLAWVVVRPAPPGVLLMPPASGSATTTAP